MKLKKSNLKKLGLILLALLPILFSQTTYAKEFSKKELKVIKKNIGHTLAGNKAKKVFKKGERVAILGNNLVFRTSAKVVKKNSWKDSTKKGFRQSAYAAYSTLEGIDDSVFQDITNEYNKMFIERLKGLGMEVMPISEIEKAKSFSKLVGDAKPSTGKGTRTEKKNWGVSKTFTPDSQYSVWLKFTSPFAPVAKMPKQLKASFLNAFIHVNFAQMDVDVSSSTYRGKFKTSHSTKGIANIVPVINIAKGTDVYAASKKGFYTTRITTPGNAQALNIMSDIDYSTVDFCKSNCSLNFASGGFFQGASDIGLYTVNADPVKFKAAALDALSNYLDIMFTLYAEK